mmetsp:Transcript_61308/g.145984  ORF Transcript_61308/g.145984 Transcript_61308/m.145984 type:complete len:215 (+) Transcript_61308:60-704(+)
MGAEISNTCGGLCGGGADDYHTENVQSSATSTATPRVDAPASAGRIVVQSSDVSRLVGMGFPERQAREALESTGGDFDQATALLVSDDEVQGEVQGEVEEFLIPPPAPADDGFIPPPVPAASGARSGRTDENVESLVAMGFPTDQARRALDRTGGNLEDAIQVLTGGGDAPAGQPDEKVDQLVSMGFERQKVIMALQSCGGNVEMASAMLLSDG